MIILDKILISIGKINELSAKFVAKYGYGKT